MAPTQGRVDWCQHLSRKHTPHLWRGDPLLPAIKRDVATIGHETQRSLGICTYCEKQQANVGHWAARLADPSRRTHHIAELVERDDDDPFFGKCAAAAARITDEMGADVDEKSSDSLADTILAWCAAKHGGIKEMVRTNNRALGRVASSITIHYGWGDTSTLPPCRYCR